MPDMQKLNAFKGSYFEVWLNYGKPDARCLSDATYALNADEAIRKAAEHAPPDLDLSKVTAFKVKQ